MEATIAANEIFSMICKIYGGYQVAVAFDLIDGRVCANFEQPIDAIVGYRKNVSSW